MSKHSETKPDFYKSLVSETVAQLARCSTIALCTSPSRSTSLWQNGNIRTPPLGRQQVGGIGVYWFVEPINWAAWSLHMPADRISIPSGPPSRPRGLLPDRRGRPALGLWETKFVRFREECEMLMCHSVRTREEQEGSLGCSGKRHSWWLCVFDVVQILQQLPQFLEWSIQ